MADPIPITPGRKEIVDVYAEALARLKNIISSEDFTTATRRQAAEKIISIQNHIKHLKKYNRKWAQKYIPDSYKIGLNQNEEILKRFLGNEYTGQFSELHKSAAAVVAEGTVQDFDAVANAMDTTYTGYIRRAQIHGLRQKAARSIAGGIVEGSTRETTSLRILEDLRSDIFAGKITVGKVTMNAKAYSDLLARTVTRAARTEGTINDLTDNDIDLVIISNTGAVDFCTEYEDQIFSLSGQSKKYPKLTARPPFHPNCTHTLSRHSFRNLRIRERKKKGRSSRMQISGNHRRTWRRNIRSSKTINEPGQRKPRKRHDMRLIIITAYCFLSLICGIYSVRTTLSGDIIRGGMEYGRVELGCSYWYELYEPRELISAWKNKEIEPILFPLIDRAASPLYWKRYI